VKSLRQKIFFSGLCINKMPMRSRYGRRRGRKSTVAKKMRRAYMKRTSGKNAVRRLNSQNQGYLNVNRRLPVVAMAANEGSVNLIDPTFDCISLGTPTAVPGGLANVFDIPFSMTFQLDQLAGFGEFTSLFDQYKINAVKVLVRSYANTDGTLGFPMPWIECWNDHDSNIPPTVAASREIMGVKHKYFNATKNVVSLYVKPKPKLNVQLQPGILPTRTQWLDCAIPTIQHFSIKGIIHNYTLAGSAGNNRLEFDITQNVSFKDIQ